MVDGMGCRVKELESVDVICDRLVALQGRMMQHQNHPDVARMLCLTYVRDSGYLVQHFTTESIRQYSVMMEFFLDYVRAQCRVR